MAQNSACRKQVTLSSPSGHPVLREYLPDGLSPGASCRIPPGEADAMPGLSQPFATTKGSTRDLRKRGSGGCTEQPRWPPRPGGGPLSRVHSPAEMLPLVVCDGKIGSVEKRRGRERICQETLVGNSQR